MKLSARRTWVAPTVTSTADAKNAKAQQTGQPYDNTYGYTSNGVLIQLLHS